MSINIVKCVSVRSCRVVGCVFACCECMPLLCYLFSDYFANEGHVTALSGLLTSTCYSRNVRLFGPELSKPQLCVGTKKQLAQKRLCFSRLFFSKCWHCED